MYGGHVFVASDRYSVAIYVLWSNIEHSYVVPGHDYSSGTMKRLADAPEMYKTRTMV